MSLDEFTREMPKVELHVHLEGSIRPSTVLELARRNGVTLPADDLEGMRQFYRFTDFDHFIRVYFAVSSCLKTVEDYDLIAYEFGADMARQNTRYAEVTVTPCTNVELSGLPFDDVMGGLNEGRRRAGREFGVEFRWVLDIVRNNPETQQQVTEWAISARDRGVISLGLGGIEPGYPPELFVNSFARAREAGLHSVPHAGEIAGPESVWGSIRALGAERIGHGVRSIEDADLVAFLRERQIPLEVSPTSNLCVGVYPSYELHPIRWLWDEGLYVTLNSDDPPMFNTDLVGEYTVLAQRLGFTVDELERLSLNGLRASFLPESRKDLMRAEFEAEFSRLRAAHLATGRG
jgi:adenosine deaminase